MKPVHKFVWALMVSLALLLSGCGGSSGGGALGGEDMERAETQTAALKMAYDAAVAALVTLEDDFSDATQAEVDAVEEKLTALKAAVAAAADVSDEVKAMYSVQAIETRLAAGKKSARLALEAEIAEKARMERAVPQTAALKAAYDAADAALKTLESDASDATRAEVDDVETKLAALKTAITAAVDVSDEVKAMYLAQTIEDRLTAAKKNARLALEADDAKIAREQTEAAAKAARAETQAARLKAAYDAAVAALATLEDDTDDATQAELKDAKDKLGALKELIDDDDPETGTPDVSDEVKEMYPADTLQTRLDEAEKLARLALAWDKTKVDAETAMTAAGEAIMAAGTAIEGAEEAVEDLNFIRIQTSGGNMVTQDVERARMAYDAAKAAYDAAKEKHDMDRDEADTTEEVNALKAAAEAAKTAAETAKTNAEAAKTAAETGVERVSMTVLQYDDGAYRVGDVSINPTTIGKVKGTRTVDGKEIVTGLVEAITVRSKLIGGSKEYTKGEGDSRVGNPSVEANAVEVMLGGKYDSADDKVRLRLITHYSSKTKKIGLHGGDLGADRDSAAAAAPEDTVELESTPDAPYGMYDHDDDDETPALKVFKASDIDFHVLHSGSNVPHAGSFGSYNIRSYWIENLGDQSNAPNKVTKPTKAGNVFYYGETDNDGVRDALRLTDTAVAADGTVTYIYRRIQAYEGPAAPVLEEAKAYEHINYGIWSKLSPSGNQSADLGIGFVRMLADGARTGSDTPSGTATYSGHYVANVRAAASGEISEHSGTSTVTAKFDDNTVTVVLGVADEDGYSSGSGEGLLKDDTQLATLEGAISGDSFSGTKVTDIKALGGLTASSNTEDNAGDYTGNFSGAFFGAKAAEAGGIFDFSHKSDKSAFRGAFGGVKQPATESSDDDDS